MAHGDTPSFDDTDPIYILRRQLKFRSYHRGTKECDLLLGSFADRYVDGFDEPQLRRFGALLEVADHDLYAWATGAEPVPAEFDNDVMRLLANHRYIDTTQ